MVQCKKCGKKGLLLRLEKDTGLCLSCKGAFVERAKPLAERLMEAENMCKAAFAEKAKPVTEKLVEGKEIDLAALSDDPKAVVTLCEAVEESAKELLSLKKEYSLESGPELLELITKYREMKQKVLDNIKE